jgi:hypothetical protein
MSAAQLRALETLLTSAEFKAAIAASGVRTLNFVTTNFMSPSLSGGGHYYINPFSVSDGTTIVDPSKLVKNISALPTREQINQFQASVTAFGETGVKIDFATIDFQESITQLERIKGLASQFKEPTKYKLELSINSISCYASSYFKILTVGYKLTDEKFVECVNNPRVY